jgi:LDH2 family malate/lactate/ureidoglycolate dehydrogenase
MIVINPANFTPLEAFKKRVDELFQTIKSSPTAPGVNEIFIPGELEFRTKEKRLKEGIPVDEKTWQSIEIVAKELGLDISKIV